MMVFIQLSSAFSLPVKEYSRPCIRDSCTGPSTPQPPSERCGARGLPGSLCRVCEHARCAQSWNRAGPPRCRRTATPAVYDRKITLTYHI